MKDDIKNCEILLDSDKIRGAYIHAFNAMERAIDILLIRNRYKAKDRFARKAAIKETLGKEFLGKYEELYDKRRNGMYDLYGIFSKEDISRIINKIIPRILKKSEVEIDEK